jgi:hypothetical protein
MMPQAIHDAAPLAPKHRLASAYASGGASAKHGGSLPADAALLGAQKANGI